MAESPQYIVNNILCYISTARDSVSEANLITNCTGFYDTDQVRDAQQIICDLAKVRAVNRKSSKNVPDPKSVIMQDILEAFEKLESNEEPLPMFVASGFDAFPPRGFEYVAPILCSMREQMASMTMEIKELKEESQSDVRALNSIDVAVQDISEIKTIVQRTYSSSLNNNSNSEENKTSVSDSDAPSSSAQPALIMADNAPSTNADMSKSSEAANQNNSNENEGFTIVRSKRPYANALRNAARKNSIRNNSSSNVGNSRQQKQRNSKQNKSIITGTRTSNSSISGGTRIYDVYVGGCSNDTSTDSLKSYCSENGVDLKSCELLQAASSWVRSFKISSTLEDRDKLLKGDFWPCGIIVRKFFKARTRDQ